MRSEFAAAVDPIFDRALDLVARIEQGRCNAPERERQELLQAFAAGRARCGHDRRFDHAAYALAAWIDELLVDLPWSGAQWWSNNVLEMELFRTRVCSERFFTAAREASADEQRDALEVFYYCVILGFRGVYGDADRAARVAVSLGIPPTLELWLEQTAAMIGSASLPNVPLAAERVISGAPPLGGRLSMVLWSVTAGVLVVINAAIHQLIVDR